MLSTINKDVMMKVEGTATNNPLLVNACPKCGSDQWVRIRRAWWQKLAHRQENRCYCLNCQHKFWRVSHWR